MATGILLPLIHWFHYQIELCWPLNWTQLIPVGYLQLVFKLGSVLKVHLLIIQNLEHSPKLYVAFTSTGTI